MGVQSALSEQYQIKEFSTEDFQLSDDADYEEMDHDNTEDVPNVDCEISLATETTHVAQSANINLTSSFFNKKRKALKYFLHFKFEKKAKIKSMLTTLPRVKYSTGANNAPIMDREDLIIFYSIINSLQCLNINLNNASRLSALTSPTLQPVHVDDTCQLIKHMADNQAAVEKLTLKLTAESSMRGLRVNRRHYITHLKNKKLKNPKYMKLNFGLIQGTKKTKHK
jgi:hypothetical protein